MSNFYDAFEPAPPEQAAAPVVPITNGRATAYAYKAFTLEIERVAAAPNGQRNHILYTAARNLGELIHLGLDYNQITDQLAGAAQHNGLTRDDGQTAVDATIRSGLKAGEQTPRHPSVREEIWPPSPAEPAPTVAADAATNIELDIEAVRRALPALDWHELWTRPDEDEEWIVEPLLPARRLIALYSPPKMGKSILMLELAAAVAAGRHALGSPTTQQRVLYVDFENDPAQDTRERLKAMSYKPEDLDDLRMLSFPTIAALDTPQGGLELMAAVYAYQCTVVIIDTVSRAVRGEENENDTWLAFYRHTGLLLKQNGISLVRLDHAGKDIAKGQRGGSAKSGDVDAIWRLDTVAGSSDTFHLKCEAHRFRLIEEEVVFTRQDLPLRSQVDANPRKAAAEAKERMWTKALDMAHLTKPVSVRRAQLTLRASGVKAGRLATFSAWLRTYNGGVDGHDDMSD